jgi:hypothetical protein
MPETFNIRAGAKALEHIRRQGLQAQDIDVMVGAAGGPKWIILHGLDQYLMKEWFTDSNQELHLIGSSAGAWRLLCYTLDQPTDAIDRLLKHYTEQEYHKQPSQSEVTEKLENIIAKVLEGESLNLLSNQTKRKLYILSSLSTFNKKQNSKYKKEFLSLFLRNLVSRKNLSQRLQRIVFTNSIKTDFIKPDDFRTKYITLNHQNIHEAVRSSGTLPMYMHPVENIQGVKGMLWDGALIDYHIGLDYNNSGLILYPHFSDNLIEGWFDKFLPYRKFSSMVIDKMILISPSSKFIQSLPDAKIPDRTDFSTYMNKNRYRIENWYKASDQSKEIAHEFHELWTSGQLYDEIKSL